MSTILFMLLFCLVPFVVETRRVSNITAFRCRTPRIANGEIFLRKRNRVVRFFCNPSFELVGNRYATCYGGEWDAPTPICVRPSPNCVEPLINNGVTIPSQNNAWLLFWCMPGHKLVGSTALYCDGRSWNGTAPSCVSETGNTEVQLSCDFESPTICGWRQDDTHDFDWKRHNMRTPSSFAFTGPSFDHTLGNGSTGYYMYIESSSRSSNATARLLSPVFDGSLSKNGCFSFFYHMYGKSIGGLRVYQIPEDSARIVNLDEEEKRERLLFEKWGNWGDFWFRNVAKLTETNSNFQIVIEGIRGSSFMSDIAIDDVALLQGDQCKQAAATAVTPPELKSDSCSNRCDVLGPVDPDKGCGCSFNCVVETGDCCPDFYELCVFVASPSGLDDDDDVTNSTFLPRTEKLIGSTTTTSTTSTTTTPSTTTRRTTRVTVTLPSPTTPVRTTLKTTISTTTKSKTVPTTVKMGTTPTNTPNTTTKLTTTPTTAVTTKATTKVVPKTTRWTNPDVEKARKEQQIESNNVVKEKENHEGSSGSTAALVCSLLVVLCCAGGALLALRSARGRAALARLRARTTHDTEVQYLTRDCD